MVGTKILVVEDERITGEDIKDGLESLGYIVPPVVSSGEEAIEKAQEFQPDLVLMDIRLEGKMDGIEAAEQIIKHLDIPIIYLTAYSDEDTVERAKKTEPSGYILKEPFELVRKPFEESELHSIIEITLYRRRMEKVHDQWLSAMLGSIHDAVIAIDQNKRILFMNHIADALTGWLQKDAIGKDLSDVFKILDDESNSLKALGTSYSLDQVILTRKDGTKIPINGDLIPIKDEKGNTSGMVVVFRDMA